MKILNLLLPYLIILLIIFALAGIFKPFRDDKNANLRLIVSTIATTILYSIVLNFIK